MSGRSADLLFKGPAWILEAYEKRVIWFQSETLRLESLIQAVGSQKLNRFESSLPAADIQKGWKDLWRSEKTRETCWIVRLSKGSPVTDGSHQATPHFNRL